jgi:hypothetical protein
LNIFLSCLFLAVTQNLQLPLELFAERDSIAIMILWFSIDTDRKPVFGAGGGTEARQDTPVAVVAAVLVVAAVAWDKR